jgi:hypothetical protein
VVPPNVARDLRRAALPEQAPVKAPEPSQQGDAAAEKPIADAIEQPVPGVPVS